MATNRAWCPFPLKTIGKGLRVSQTNAARTPPTMRIDERHVEHEGHRSSARVGRWYRLISSKRMEPSAVAGLVTKARLGRARDFTLTSPPEDGLGLHIISGRRGDPPPDQVSVLQPT